MLELSRILGSVVKQLTSESQERTDFYVLSTVKPICLQHYVISLTQQQIRLVELGLPCVQSIFCSFFFPRVEILSEWRKETLALCQGLLANTIAYH